MPRYYTYLISSFPYLYFDRDPPFSFLEFLEKCKNFISEEEIDFLKMIKEKEPDVSKIRQSTLRRWFEFEFSLRNELAKLRAVKRGEEPTKYLRKTDYLLPLYLVNLVYEAFKNPNPLEGEKILDYIRWRFLEDLEAGHFFDLGFLIVYGIKLNILERWWKIQKVDKKSLLEKLIA